MVNEAIHENLRVVVEWKTDVQAFVICLFAADPMMVALRTPDHAEAIRDCESEPDESE